MLELIISVISFLNSFYFFTAEVTGKLFFKIVFKLIGIFGVFLPLIYWSKLLNII